MRARGFTIVETMVGVLMLGICAVPILGCVAWIRRCSADAATDALVSSALREQVSLVKSLGRATALTAGTTNSTKALGRGSTLAVVRTVTAISGTPRLYDLKVVGTWSVRGNTARSMTLETYVFAPDN